jgi:hypothetical protein
VVDRFSTKHSASLSIGEITTYPLLGNNRNVAFMAGHWAVIAAATLLFATPTLAARPDPAPIVSTDPTTHATLVSGPHHSFKAALTLIRTDWWLTGTNAAPDPVLMFTVDMPDWPILDHSATASGQALALVVLDRRTSPLARSLGQERVAITLPRALADRMRVADLAITVIGKSRSFLVTVPHAEMAAFLDGYDAATAGAPTPAAAVATAAPVTAAPETAHAEPAAAPPAADTGPPHTPAATPTPPHDTAGDHQSVSTPSVSADATPTIASLGIQIAATSSGAMVLAVTPGSKAATLGITGGDFIESVDGKSLKGLTIDEVVARIGAPGIRTLNCTAAGLVKLR